MEMGRTPSKTGRLFRTFSSTKNSKHMLSFLFFLFLLSLVLESLTSDLMGNSALLTVLRQEIDRFNGLLCVVHNSLNLLTLAVRGEIVMSEALEDAYDALLSQRIPLEWRVGPI